VSYFDAGADSDGTRPFVWVTDEAEAATSVAGLVADAGAWRALSERCSSYFAARHTAARAVMAYAALLHELGIQTT
jgi:hypothetical protein